MVSDFKAKFSQRGGLPAWDVSVSMGYASLAMAKGDTKEKQHNWCFLVLKSAMSLNHTMSTVRTSIMYAYHVHMIGTCWLSLAPRKLSLCHKWPGTET